MKAFVTGGAGFIGRRVVQKLLDRGYEVWALARSARAATDLEGLGVRLVWGDITEPETMREGMRGSEIVFHIAGWYHLGGRDGQEAWRVNVEGTRAVLQLAYALGVPRILYVSSVAVFGDGQGQVREESSPRPEGPFLTEYDRTKSVAHFDVALPLIASGAPIIIAMPGGVYGPGDHSLMGEAMKAFARGLLTVLPGPELALTFAHVDDVAEGIILAAEKGRIGESYILAGPGMQMGEAVKLWAEASGRPAPRASIPARFVKPLAPLASALGAILPPAILPPLLSRDQLTILDATYLASSEKALSELGWQPRPTLEGFRQTFQALRQPEPPAWPAPSPQRQFATILLAAAVGILIARSIQRRRG